MNKGIKRLVESLFDDDFDDVIGTTDDNETSNMLNNMSKNMLKWIEQYLTDQTFSARHGVYTRCIENDKRVYAEVDNDTVAFYYNTSEKDNPKYYLTYVSFNTLECAKKFIDELEEYSINNVLMRFNVEIGRFGDTKPDEAQQNVLDLKNINFDSIGLKGIYPKNLRIDGDKIKEKKLFETVYNSNTWYANTKPKVSVDLLRCWIDDSVEIISTDSIGLQECFNMNDYSFIKKVNDTFRNNTYTYQGLPKTYNFIGLPDGNYDIQMELRDERTKQEPYQELDNIGKKINFVGLPKCDKIWFRTELFPWRVLPYISFEGLTMDILPKLDFVAGGFPGKGAGIWIQLGPYKFAANCRRWKPTKPQWKTILTSKDWFLDCYYEKKGPHHEYVEPSNEESSSELIKNKTNIDKVNLKASDKAEDDELMKQNCLKYLKEKQTYFGNNWTIYIKSLGDKFISYTIMKRLSIKDEYKTYSAFCKWLDHTSFKMEKGGTVTMRDTIVKPVEERRAKIVAERKEEAKRLKAELKAKEKETTKKVRVVKDDETTSIDSAIKKRRGRPKKVVSEPIEEKPVNNSNVHIYDYSDRAIAIYGDYKDIAPIKDQLKEIGCKYNKFLNINGVKTPGWIVSNKKREEVEKIVNNS